MFTSLISAVLLSVSAQPANSDAGAQGSKLSQESKAVLRCSAAFALVSYGQSNGDADALKWPDVNTRGREFFVRSMAQMMDETGLNREGIADLVGKEAQRLSDTGEVYTVMPACLVMLDASGV
ncbi:hypothetical protein [Erythrobacter crassostreae]|uniref:Uncharacterized protein n=1 Tax=Erythrobacter crassostreae TaxID=2828328 RepID=A0A9X1F280_9SPHN|nr:hypothetical protein [Erythrobacter crassostrea]MBV7258960.1 hypothetical protein [Erythrobacter crassostrea]